MTEFQMLEYAAWGLSAILGFWMLFDLVMTDRAHSEDLLISSKEGEIEDILAIDSTRPGGRR